MHSDKSVKNNEGGYCKDFNNDGPNLPSGNLLYISVSIKVLLIVVGLSFDILAKIVELSANLIIPV